VPLLRDALTWVFGRVSAIYFREIESTGDVPRGDVGGRLFVSNHFNALVDPIVMITTTACPISPVAKSTLWDVPGLRPLLDAAGAVPIVRRRDAPDKSVEANEAVFDRVADFLAARGNILIFPEGTSHSFPKLLEVKTGPARMLARARERGARGLTFQAVGIEFDAKDEFRSRALLVYGPVREVDAMGLEGDALVAAITETIRGDLTDALVEGPTHEERLLIARVAELVANDGGDGTLAGWSDVGRRVEAAHAALQTVDGASLIHLANAVDRYYVLLGEEGLVDADVARAAGAETARAMGRKALRRGLLALAMPLALLGMVLYWLPYQVPRLAASRAREADMISTVKLGAGLAVFPLWSIALVAGTFLLFPPEVAAVVAAFVLASPFAALAWLDVTPRLRRRLRLAGRGARLAALREARARAMTLVGGARARLGV
jgi:1-acyl-sn-glycerol-3-phosphate acyltransferase